MRIELLALVGFLAFICACGGAQASVWTSSCGSYGPRYFINAGASLQTTAVFSAPLSAISSGPYLLGCTPSQATVQTKSGSEYVIYAYTANGFLVSTAHWYRDGSNLGTVVNEYLSYTPRFPRVIGNSQFTFGEQFINFTMEYSDGSNAHLDSVSIFSPDVLSSQYKEMMESPIAPGRFHPLSQRIKREMEENEQLRLKDISAQKKGEKEKEKETVDGERIPEDQYTGFITYAYEDNNVPYQATNITNTNSDQGTTEIFNQFTTNSQNYISKIAQTISGSSGKNTNTRYIYYDSNSGLVTKICEVSCVQYSYDSNGRLTSVSENGQTLESYKYTTSGGVSRITSADLGTFGKWTFTY